MHGDDKDSVEAASVPWRPLGELFVSRGLITEAELETALAEQAATGKRLGEILVDRGLVSGPDLTSALMDQLGVEISKEEGFGSGLWAEIKRRHRRARPEDADGAPEAAADGNGQPEIALVPPLQESRVAEPQPEPYVQPEPAIETTHEPLAVPPELEQELEEIRADYQPPSERELEPEPEPELPPAAEAEPEPEPAVEPEPEPEPELPPAAEAEPEPEVEYEPEPQPGFELVAEAEPEPEFEPEPEVSEPVAEDEDVAALRVELEDARTDLAHLQEMLADAMTALAALTAEAAGETYE